jgi:hypothetical protein
MTYLEHRSQLAWSLPSTLRRPLARIETVRISPFGTGQAAQVYRLLCSIFLYRTPRPSCALLRARLRSKVDDGVEMLVMSVLHNIQ